MAFLKASVSHPWAKSSIMEVLSPAALFTHCAEVHWFSDNFEVSPGSSRLLDRQVERIPELRI